MSHNEPLPLADVINGIIESAQEERAKTQDYQDLVAEHTADIRRGLDMLNHKIVTLCLDYLDIIKDTHNIVIGDDILHFVLGLPISWFFLEKIIESQEGPTFCTDKTRQRLAMKLKRLIDASRDNEATAVSEIQGGGDVK